MTAEIKKRCEAAGSDRPKVDGTVTRNGRGWRHTAFAVFMGALMLVNVPNAFARGEGTTFEPTFKPFVWIQASFVNDETGGKYSTFQFKRTRFGTRGMAYEKVGYHFMMEGILGGKSPTVMQAWVDYRLHPLANVRVGQFKYPFGIEAYPGFITWKFINPSFVTLGVTKELGRIHPGGSSGLFRDVGIQFGGEYKTDSGYAVGYKAMVMNGNGILKTDDNDDKDVVLHGNLKAPLGIHLGLSYFKGTFESVADGASFDESAVGIDFMWQHKVLDRAFRIQGEYILGNYETTDADIEPQGFYFYGTYFALPKVEVAVRYDWFEPNKNAVNSVERKRTTFGVGYYLYKNQQINVNYEICDDDLKKVDNIFTTQFQVAF